MQAVLGLPSEGRLAYAYESMSWLRSRAILKEAPPRTEATHVMVHCYGGYTTNIPLDDLKHPEVCFAYLHDGRELTREHGFPVRLVVPYRYAWKSAKWVKGIEYLVGDKRGFWENYGYSINADAWTEERYG